MWGEARGEKERGHMLTTPQSFSDENASSPYTGEPSLRCGYSVAVIVLLFAV